MSTADGDAVVPPSSAPIAPETSALSRLLDTPELLTLIISWMDLLTDRVVIQRTCAALLQAAREPTLWTALHIEGRHAHTLLNSISWLHGATTSLRLRLGAPAPGDRDLRLLAMLSPMLMQAHWQEDQDAQEEAAAGAEGADELAATPEATALLFRAFPRLVELDLSGSTMATYGSLLEALRACGATLARLDLSGCRLFHGRTALLGMASDACRHLPLGCVRPRLDLAQEIVGFSPYLFDIAWEIAGLSPSLSLCHGTSAS